MYSTRLTSRCRQTSVSLRYTTAADQPNREAGTPEPRIRVETGDLHFEFLFSAAYLDSLTAGDQLPEGSGGGTQETTQERVLSLLRELCRKDRLLEIVHDFMVFDAGTKKTCRHNQYFGVWAAQTRVRRREGGILWHTQGSGKSLIMVWLAKWIREHVQGGRVLIITDRTELDEQIEMVFKGVSEDLYRTRSGADPVRVLNASEEWLVSSLIHKFGASDEGDIGAFIDDIKRILPRGFYAKGELFVFVDECHRTQSGKLHEARRCATALCWTCVTRPATSTNAAPRRRR